jgi:hypothetical protein
MRMATSRWTTFGLIAAVMLLLGMLVAQSCAMTGPQGGGLFYRPSEEAARVRKPRSERMPSPERLGILA